MYSARPEQLSPSRPVTCSFCFVDFLRRGPTRRLSGLGGNVPKCASSHCFNRRYQDRRLKTMTAAAVSLTTTPTSTATTGTTVQPAPSASGGAGAAAAAAAVASAATEMDSIRWTPGKLSFSYSPGLLKAATSQQSSTPTTVPPIPPAAAKVPPPSSSSSSSATAAASSSSSSSLPSALLPLLQMRHNDNEKQPQQHDAIQSTGAVRPRRYSSQRGHSAMATVGGGGDAAVGGGGDVAHASSHLANLSQWPDCRHNSGGGGGGGVDGGPQGDGIIAAQRNRKKENDLTSGSDVCQTKAPPATTKTTATVSLSAAEALRNGTLARLLQKDISIITLRDLRYEGKLCRVDAGNSTVTLENVRNLGTEQRSTWVTVQPASRPYAFIVFNVNCIKCFQPVTHLDAKVDTNVSTEIADKSCLKDYRDTTTDTGRSRSTRKASTAAATCISPPTTTTTTTTTIIIKKPSESAGGEVSRHQPSLQSGIDINRLLAASNRSQTKAVVKIAEPAPAQRKQQRHQQQHYNCQNHHQQLQAQQQQQQQQRHHESARRGDKQGHEGSPPKLPTQQSMLIDNDRNSRRRRRRRRLQHHHHQHHHQHNGLHHHPHHQQQHYYQHRDGSSEEQHDSDGMTYGSSLNRADSNAYIRPTQRPTTTTTTTTQFASLAGSASFRTGTAKQSRSPSVTDRPLRADVYRSSRSSSTSSTSSSINTNSTTSSEDARSSDGEDHMKHLPSAKDCPNQQKDRRHVTFKTSQYPHEQQQQPVEIIHRAPRRFTHIPRVPRDLVSGGHHEYSSRFGKRNANHRGSDSEDHHAQNQAYTFGRQRQRPPSTIGRLFKPGEFARSRDPVRFTEEFDFEKALEEFKELSLSSKSSRDDTLSGVEASNANDSSGGARQTDDCYNRDRCFYDSLSTTIRADTLPRRSRREEIRVNKETFGELWLRHNRRYLNARLGRSRDSGERRRGHPMLGVP